VIRTDLLHNGLLRRFASEGERLRVVATLLSQEFGERVGLMSGRHIVVLRMLGRPLRVTVATEAEVIRMTDDGRAGLAVESII